MRTIAESASSFEELTEVDIFIDKSMFIQNILNDSSESILITRPRRWGKTLNLMMLRDFLEPDIDAKGIWTNQGKPNRNITLFDGTGVKKRRLKIC